MEDRRQQLRAWCENRLGPVSGLEPLPVEASTRRFYRVRVRSATFIAMDAPPATENNTRFRDLSRVFRANGVPVPEVLAFDERGFLAVTDFGDRLFARVYEEGGQDSALELALQALVRIQNVSSDHIPPYTAARFRDELGIFSEWLVERFLRLPQPPFLDAAWRELVDATQGQPPVTVHRDYHSRNLLLRPDGQLGIVDFQDALEGPVTYDLVSLLRDCYHEFAEPQVERWWRRYRELRDCGMNEDAFVRAFDLTGMQRHLKAAGIFARLHLRDGRDSHLTDIAPTLSRVVAVGDRYPELRRLAGWIDGEVLPAVEAATCAR